MTKMRKGQSRSLNTWLRVRIVAQGLTIAAVVAGSWAYGTSRPSPELDAAAARDKAVEERIAFEDRLRLAEEVTRAESGSAPAPAPPTTNVQVPAPPEVASRSWWSW